MWTVQWVLFIMNNVPNITRYCSSKKTQMKASLSVISLLTDFNPPRSSQILADINFYVPSPLLLLLIEFLVYDHLCNTRCFILPQYASGSSIIIFTAISMVSIIYCRDFWCFLSSLLSQCNYLLLDCAIYVDFYCQT